VVQVASLTDQDRPHPRPSSGFQPVADGQLVTECQIGLPGHQLHSLTHARTYVFSVKFINCSSLLARSSGGSLASRHDTSVAATARGGSCAVAAEACEHVNTVAARANVSERDGITSGRAACGRGHRRHRMVQQMHVRAQGPREDQCQHCEGLRVNSNINSSKLGARSKPIFHCIGLNCSCWVSPGRSIG
jgi:hypothetical protein